MESRRRLSKEGRTPNSPRGAEAGATTHLTTKHHPKNTVMTTRSSNAQRGSANSEDVAERIPHRGRSLNIGRLPFAIREDLNNWLMENVPVKDILNWLNTDSEVRHYLERLFESRQITEQNVSDWRQSGYQEWITYRSSIEDVRDVAEDAARIALTDINAEHLLLSLIATFAQCTARQRLWSQVAERKRHGGGSLK